MWRADVAARLIPACGTAATAVVAAWSESAGAVDLHVPAILRNARRLGWRLGLLTNATSRLAADLEKLGLEDEFDVVINSAEVGVAKPDPEAFRRACRRMDVEPDGCVFVDDAVANVAAAAKVGLDAHFFHGTAALAFLLGMPVPEPTA